MSTIWEFHHIENKHEVYRDENRMKNFCKSLKEHVLRIIELKKENDAN